MDDLLLSLVLHELEPCVYVVRLVCKRWYGICMDGRPSSPLRSRLSPYLEGGPPLLHWILAQPGVRAALRADGRLRATLAYRSMQLADATLLFAAAPLHPDAHRLLVGVADAPFVERMLLTSLFAGTHPAQCFEVAYMRGDERAPEVLAALAHVFGRWCPPSATALRCAARRGQLLVAAPAYGGRAQLVRSVAEDTRATDAVASGLAHAGDVRTLREWVPLDRSPHAVAAALGGALRGANEPLVDELLALGASLRGRCVLDAMQGGSLRLLARAWAAAPVSVDANELAMVDIGRDVLDWSLEHGCFRVDDGLVVLASRLGRLEVVERLLRLEPPIQMGTRALSQIPWAGFRRGSAHVLRVLELLRAHKYALCDGMADAAAGVGQVDVLEWLHARGCTPTPDALPTAIYNHNWLALEWLHRHGKHEAFRFVPLWEAQLGV